jgi:hypothetical protein
MRQMLKGREPELVVAGVYRLAMQGWLADHGNGPPVLVAEPVPAAAPPAREAKPPRKPTPSRSAAKTLRSQR